MSRRLAHVFNAPCCYRAIQPGSDPKVFLMPIYHDSREGASRWFAQRLVELLKECRSEGDMKKVHFLEQLLGSPRKSESPA